MKSRFFIPVVFATVIHALFFFGFRSPPADVGVAVPASTAALAKPTEKRKVSTLELTFSDLDSAAEVEKAPRVPAPKIDLRKEDFVDARANDPKRPPTDSAASLVSISPEWVKEARERENSPEGKEWLEAIADRHGRVQRLEALDQMPVVRSQTSVMPITEPSPGDVVVWVMFVIDQKGRVIEVKAEEDTPAALVSKAEEVVRGWKFDPGIMKGKPVVFRMTAPVVFPRNDP